MSAPATAGMPRIFFSSTIYPPFIDDDFAALTKHFRVEKQIGSGARAVPGLIAGVARNDISIAWFGSVYAGIIVFLARLFGKKSIVVVAGVDASKDPGINYGIWLSPWKSLFVRYAYRNADRVLPVAPFLSDAVKRLADYDGKNITTIPFGFDGRTWSPAGEKEPLVLTVASCENEWRMKKKGIDKIFLAARALPGVRFRVVGVRAPLAERIAPDVPPNVEIAPYVPRAELVSEYRRAKVFCQPSFTEGLPNTLCEAMACGCIPVGTVAGGIPTAIGEAGFLVAYGDQAALEAALRGALELPVSAGEQARERILRYFTVEQRETALLEVINALLA